MTSFTQHRKQVDCCGIFRRAVSRYGREPEWIACAVSPRITVVFRNVLIKIIIIKKIDKR